MIFGSCILVKFCLIYCGVCCNYCSGWYKSFEVFLICNNFECIKILKVWESCVIDEIIFNKEVFF